MYNSRIFEWFAAVLLLTLLLSWWQTGSAWSWFLALIEADSYRQADWRSGYRIILPSVAILTGLAWLWYRWRGQP